MIRVVLWYQKQYGELQLRRRIKLNIGGHIEQLLRLYAFIKINQIFSKAL